MKLLAHPAWGLTQTELWSLSLESYKARQLWIETMLANEGKLADIAEWLVYCAHLSLHEPLEYVIDHLTGTETAQLPESSETESEDFENSPGHESFISPLRDYFFSSNRLDSDPSSYVAYLDALASIRRKIRDYRPEGRLLLRELVHFLEQYRELGLTVQASGRVAANGQPVELLTAHRSKGLEFDTVFVVGLADSVWGETARNRGKLISYPHNLPIGISGDSSDEHIRLLFVALTRGKNNLYLSAHNLSPSGKALLPVGYLSHVDVADVAVTAPSIEAEQTAWHAGLTRPQGHDLQELLRDTLATYRLSATHLCNFLDITRGGPELFLLQNLLRFPQAMSPSAAFGSAIHTTLQRAHAHLAATGKKRPVEDLLGDFETALGEYQIASDQYDHFAKKGTDVLTHFLAARYDSFSPNQLVEQRFAADLVLDDTVRLSGAIDLMEVDHDSKTIVVTDYKTGKTAQSWQGRTDYEKVKLYHYRQQLLFYKLLIENSREYSGYKVTKGIIEFVEADSRGTINRIELDYDTAELEEFRALVSSVWTQIQTSKFSIDGEFDASLGGIKAFEQSLIT